jgi:hypothetical protein
LWLRDASTQSLALWGPALGLAVTMRRDHH